ncbi:MAG: bifunctional phosphoribosyl-AMP cyclohydrolase/phosphoribosyl-ATP diphosphatase HisIE [Polyangiaceae bacterium]
MNAYPPSTPSPRFPLKFDAQGLIPVIVQDHLTGEVRMFAYATEEALRETLETGLATFFSRSRGELWRKGETSGNTIRVLRVLVDCDGDCVIYSSEPRGNSCHTGAQTCFFRSLEGVELVAANASQTVPSTLEAVLQSRKESTGKTSYTKSLYDGGAPVIGAKIREEADELARAIESETDERVVSEAADSLYHTLVGLRWRSLPFRRVWAELARRSGKSGHEEKATR